MGTLAMQADEKVKDVRFTEETITVDLMDGRTITVPLVWYPRLLNATPEQRAYQSKISIKMIASRLPVQPQCQNGRRGTGCGHWGQVR
jgi:hypothetical protein